MIIPDATANGVQNNSLKAMIIAHRPMRMRGPRKVWHDLSGEHHIARHKVCGSGLRVCHIRLGNPQIIFVKTGNGRMYKPRRGQYALVPLTFRSPNSLKQLMFLFVSYDDAASQPTILNLGTCRVSAESPLQSNIAV